MKKIVIVLNIILMLLLCMNTVMATTDENDTQNILENEIQEEEVVSGVDEIEISSNEYLISESYLYISRIPPKTTLDQFKKNFNIDSAKIRVYKDKSLQEVVESGYVATNMEVKFDGVKNTYTLSVVGDFNGDGLSNQIEIGKLIKHIVNPIKYALTDMPLISADINKDRDVNQIDLSALINYLVFGRLNIGKITKVEKPNIEIISGEQAENGSYITDVTIKITPEGIEASERTKDSEEIEGSEGTKDSEGTEDTEEPKEPERTDFIGKTTYKILGSKQVSETIIPDDGLIVLQEKGMFLIKSYTYDIDGVRSEASELIVNKTEEDIPNEHIGLMMKLNNKDGDDYQSGIWTNKSVYVEPVKTVQEFEGKIQSQIDTSYTITGKMTVVTPTREPILLKDNGEYTITTTSTDNIGRRTTNEYKVRIDKVAPESSTMTIDEQVKLCGYYNTAINVNITHGTDTLSGIKKVTYELTGDEVKEETEVQNGEKITVTNDGETKIIIRTYDIAGNMTETEQNVKIDKTGPIDVTLNASNITGTSFDLVATAKDNLSGIQRYEIYIDEDLHDKVITSGGMVSSSAIEQETMKHIVKVKVIDNADNESELSIEVTNTKLVISEIDHVAFEISSFTVSNRETNVEDTDAIKIVSSTSEEAKSKYMQVSIKQNAPNGTTGELEGKVKLIRKDGKEVTDVEFFPEDLAIEASYSSEGNGTGWNHETIAEILGIKIHDGDNELSTKIDGETKSFTIKEVLEKVKNNYFKIIEKKIQGVSSYTRLAINHVYIGSKEVSFEIVDKT